MIECGNMKHEKNEFSSWVCVQMLCVFDAINNNNNSNNKVTSKIKLGSPPN